LDGEYREADINVEICQAVNAKGKDGDGIIFKEIPETTVASVLHKGPYEKLGEAYSYAVKWVEDNGYGIVDHVRESYIDGVWNKNNAEDWLTEIQVPIKKK
jgi:effector-binding domain-containing protein